MTTTFFLATDRNNGHIVMGYGATYEDARRDAERAAENAAVKIGDLDINEVAFDEDGEQLVRVDGGRCLWSLGNYGASQLAADVRRAGLI